MLKVRENGTVFPFTSYENLSVIHKQDGMDVMTFYCDTNCADYRLIKEETSIETEDNNWLVKKIDDDRFDCELDFDFLKRVVYKDYASETQNLTQVLTRHLPEDWIIVGANVTSIGRTIKFDECTDFDVVYECMKTYGVYFVWKLKKKTLQIYLSSSIKSSGEYLTSELNLKALSFRGSTTQFATRLYAYGADGLSIADAMVDDGNGGTQKYGLPYIDNNSYSDKIVCAYWHDSRYKVAENLLEDANVVLAEMANPVRSYECEVIDLAKKNKKYDFLHFRMHTKITLVDIERGVKVEHQIVEYTEFPDDPDSNKVTLAKVPETISSSIKNKTQELADEILKQTDTFDNKISMATAMLTGVFGGHVMSSGSEIFIMDNPNPDLAQVVWRWGLNGLGKSSTGISGPYTTSLTFDDHFITNIIDAMIIRGSHIEAGSIDADKISQKYSDDILSQSYEAAKGYIDYSVSTINGFLTNENGDGKLDVLANEITNIRQTIEGLTLKFSNTMTGGINLITNSSGLNGLSDEWQYEGVVVSLQNDDMKKNTISDSGFRLSENSTLKYTVNDLIVGNNYTVSCKVKKTSVIAASIIIRVGSEDIPLFSSSEEVGWEEYSVTLEDIKVNQFDIIATTKEDYLFIADFMACEGLVPQSWTPAPNEIYTDEVKIDKHGVRVSNGETSQETVMNKEEFAGYYDGEKVFSLNKDETFNKKTIVKDELHVGSCLFLPYEQGNEIGINIVIDD